MLPAGPWRVDPLLERAKALSDVGLDKLAGREMELVEAKADPRDLLALKALILGRDGSRRASIALLREVYKKTLFLRQNQEFYHPTVAGFRRYHCGTIYGLFFLPLVWMLLRTPLGAALARRRYGGRPKLPARPADARGY